MVVENKTTLWSANAQRSNETFEIILYVFLTSTSCIYSSHLLLNLPWNVINMSCILTEKVRR